MIQASGPIPKVIIRRERASDVDGISEITKAAFEHHPHSQQTEQFIIKRLRAAGVLAVSLVAEVDGRVVGHVAFSPITIPGAGDGWFGVGPISVTPELQRRGIGKALMTEGLSSLRAAGAKGCVLVGDPEYYKRFGFGSWPGLIHEGVPQEYVLALAFDGKPVQGSVVFHPAFFAKE